MKMYKGFDKDLKCRGFHACENPMDVFRYYNLKNSRFCEVELDANDQISDDSKKVGKHIKISKEIGLSGLIQAGVEYIKERIDWGCVKATNTEDHSAAAVEGSRREKNEEKKKEMVCQ